MHIISYYAKILCILDESVMNSQTYLCFSNCATDTVDNTTDTTSFDENTCCTTASTTSGYGDAMTCNASCKF